MIDEELRRAAELEMGRVAPDSENYPKKKRKTGHQPDSKGGEGADDAGGYRTVQYEYSAAEHLLKGSPGFLVTCDFRREKSAIKEILPILDKYIDIAKTEIQGQESSPSASKPDETGDAGQVSDISKPANGKGEEDGAAAFFLTPVKLALRGAMFVRLRMSKGEKEEPDISGSAEGVPSLAIHRLVVDVEQGVHPRLKFCYRITPVEISCRMEQGAIEAATLQCSKIFLKRWAKENGPAEEDGALPRLTYAVRFQSKGSDGKAKAEAASSGGGGAPAALPKREDMIKAMAACVASACKGVAEPGADLKNPDVGCIGEGMPLASGESICAVCVVDRAICSTKPSLRLKSVSAENK